MITVKSDTITWSRGRSAKLTIVASLQLYRHDVLSICVSNDVINIFALNSESRNNDSLSNKII